MKKMMLFKEIYTPIFEKSKIIQAQHRSFIQLMSVISHNEEKGNLRQM